jgi:hypothetical protein
MVTLIGKQRHVMPILLGQSYDMVEAAMSFCMKVLLSISSLSKIQKDKACSFWKTASESDEVSSDCWLLVDIIVTKGQIMAAVPQQKHGVPQPIILIIIESGSMMPAIKWNGYESYGREYRLQNRMFGKLKGAALEQVSRVIGDKRLTLYCR